MPGTYISPAETGFYYLNSRYYDPQVGRFLNADSIIGANGGIQGYNLFAYCNNDSIGFSDSNGTCMWGDGHYLMEFAAHTLEPGDICPYCQKRVDQVFFDNFLIWTKLANDPTYRYYSGEDISNMVMCQLATAREQVEGRRDNSNGKKESSTIKAHCFVAGTKVKTEHGEQNIEDIQPGDYVLSSNPATGELDYKKVVRTFVNEVYELIIVKIGDEVIETTPEHPFYVVGCNEYRADETGLGHGWVKAKYLRVGDTLLLQDGETVKITSVDYRQLMAPVKVYNFEVEDWHTYYVGSNGYLVHNDCESYGILRSMAKSEPKEGISTADAIAYCELAEEYGVDYHGIMTHPNRSGIWSYTPHICIAGVHIKVRI